MKTITLNQRLRYHVTGAIERGEDEAIEEITQGRLDYESDCKKRPFYHDGTPRKTWNQLGELERSTWEGGRK